MYRTARRLAVLSLTLSAIVGLAACGSDSKSTGSDAEVTVAPTTPETTPAETVADTLRAATSTTLAASSTAEVTEEVIADSSTPPPTTESGAPIGQGVFEIIDLGRELRPGAGFSFETLAEGIQSELVSGFEADPNVVELVGAVGTSVMTDGSDKTLLIVLVLKRPLVRQELKDFIAGVIGGGTEVDQGAVAGTRGWTYLDSNGSRSFVTVRNNLAILAITDSADVLDAAVSGLFLANPDL